MAALSVKPTRMELQNLKKRLAVAVRGHKLMKDKRDELVRRFIVYARKNRELREQVEEKLGLAMGAFVQASALMSPNELEEALAYPSRSANIEAYIQNELSVPVPRLKVVIDGDTGRLPYGYANTVYDLDVAVLRFYEALPLLVELAEVEKACSMLSDEIEKTRRRVNALEYVMIPRFEETIRIIKMKLDENERGNITRLMKTKEMLSAK